MTPPAPPPEERRSVDELERAEELAHWLSLRPLTAAEAEEGVDLLLKLVALARANHPLGRELAKALIDLAEAREVISGLMDIAEMAMPDSYFAEDSRTTAARKFLAAAPAATEEG